MARETQCWLAKDDHESMEAASKNLGGENSMEKTLLKGVVMSDAATAKEKEKHIKLPPEVTDKKKAAAYRRLLAIDTSIVLDLQLRDGSSMLCDFVEGGDLSNACASKALADPTFHSRPTAPGIRACGSSPASGGFSVPRTSALRRR